MKLHTFLFDQLWNHGVRHIFGIPGDSYNTTVPWPFASLTELWGGRGVEVRTPRELRQALDEAWRLDCFALIDVTLERGDLSPILRGFVQAFKKQVYAS